MADEKNNGRKRPLWHPGTVLGAFVHRRYPEDAVIRALAKGGAGVVLAALALGLLDRNLSEDRRDRRAQHAEMVSVMKEQHKEDMDARRHADCINSQLTDTVRSAIWHEKPRPRDDCK